ncbi:response regulator transcription factor [cf. Phormidesmis sp. LEGE 11477]|uniref:response regulator transcription factor n=1 Tax=cf. Phormidesmis sp. LEGE 11477 TaxID=1828680 RepID=UPI00187FDE7F|nr:response regulator transcription factor [cf. Phormidesmis sp. LEGE 11477]MBE9064403.1 response regulator transcription factor [cf. Phormidesmis sp. LEGE 11477]
MQPLSNAAPANIAPASHLPQRFLLIDDHEAILAGLLPGIQQRYPAAKIETAANIQAAEQIIAAQLPTFVLADLILPMTPQSLPTITAGTRLLERLLESDLAPSLMVFSINIRPLIRLKSMINSYRSGFVAMEKSVPLQTALNRVDIALQGSIYLPPEVRSRPEIDSRWLKVLTLKYQEGLSDRAIARQMGVSDRTIRNYWLRIQDALQVRDDSRQDLRIQIQLAAREAGLIS